MVDRLQQIIEGAFPQRLAGIFKLPVPADEYKQPLGVFGQHLFHQGDPVDARHADVADNHVRGQLPDELQRFFPIPRFPDDLQVQFLPGHGHLQTA